VAEQEGWATPPAGDSYFHETMLRLVVERKDAEANAAFQGVVYAINGERAGCGSGYHTANRGVKGRPCAKSALDGT